MLKAGTSVENAARWAVPARNALKLSIREQGSFILARLEDVANFIRYGNRAGPSADQLFAQLKSWDAVLESVTRTNETVNKLLGQ
jgi:filamentous hemagglutinin